MTIRTTLHRRKPRELHCHEMVREVAEAMAHEIYAEMMRDNEVYASWKAVCFDLTSESAESEFCRRLVPELVRNGAARATLAKTLTSSMNDDLKARVYEALVLDSHLSRGRKKMRFAGTVAAIH